MLLGEWPLMPPSCYRGGMIRRIPPDKTVRHGHHFDYYWPGLVQSVWATPPTRLRKRRGKKPQIKYGFLRITRDREYFDKHHQHPKQTAWSVILFGKGIRLGLKIEVDKGKLDL